MMYKFENELLKSKNYDAKLLDSKELERFYN